MKKFLLMLSTVLMLTVCLCVPSFAVADCSHVRWLSSDYGFHDCMECNARFDCSDYDGDFFCDVCGARNLWGEFSGCSHSVSSAFVLYRDDDHFFYCPYCSVLVRVFDYYCFSFGLSPDDLAPEQEEAILAASVHTDNCLLFETEMPYSVYESGVFRCSHIMSGEMESLFYLYDDDTHYVTCLDCDVMIQLDFAVGAPCPHTANCEICADMIESGLYVIPKDGSASLSCAYFSDFVYTQDDSIIFTQLLWILARDDGHYLYCPDCGGYVSISYFVSQDIPHGSDCELCSQLVSLGAKVVTSIPSSDSPGVLSAVTEMVTASVGWITAFVQRIMSTPILLISAVLAFIAFGIGIFKRLRT